jgi:hypothetical protein
MKKEIGSIFPLSNEKICQAETDQQRLPKDRVYYSLCREALYDIAIAYGKSGGNVLIPAYTCQTVITPFEEAGWECRFYPIRKDLRIDLLGLMDAAAQYRPELLVVHPYYGMDFNDEEVEVLNRIKGQGVNVVLDLTQCIFSSKFYPFASFIVGSYRKWMPIPDGGYLLNLSNSVRITQPEIENVEFTDREIAAMYLRGQYFINGEQRTKDISIRLSKSADRLVEHDIFPSRMSQVAYHLYTKENVGRNQNCRFSNFEYLFHNIQESEKITKVCCDLAEVTTAPLYFTLYVEKRTALQRLLAQESIYAPVIWPVENEEVLINEEVRYIYDHILAIPCDQRYDESDLLRAVEIINNY